MGFFRQNSMCGNLRHLLGAVACFYQRKAGCYFLPKTIKRLFPVQLFVCLRNLRGWTSHEIMQIKDWCPSPNSFSIWIIFCRVRCFQKVWSKWCSNVDQCWHRSVAVTLWIQVMASVDTYKAWSPQLILDTVQIANWPSLPWRASIL